MTTKLSIDSSILGQLMNCWDPRHPVLPGFTCIMVYIRLRYFNTHPATAMLYSATCAFVKRVLGHRERFTEAELQPLRDALVPFPSVAIHEILALFPMSDPYRPMVRKHVEAHYRKAREAEDRRIRQAISDARHQEAEAMKAVRIATIGMAAYRAEVAAQRRVRQVGPVAVVRDPLGGIHLPAFAVDPQNIHRSSVQEATKAAVLSILKRPVPVGQNTLAEITDAMPAVENRALLVETFTRDYGLTRAFDISYSEVADRIWAFIASHEERIELTKRLSEEVGEGLGTCSNGKMARLINVVRGFDEELTLLTPPTRDLFQTRMAKVFVLPVAERESAARRLFAEFHVPDAEQAPWLEALDINIT